MVTEAAASRLAKPSRLTGSESGRRPSDLNEPGFLSRFATDIAEMGMGLPRALATMASAPFRDVSRAVTGDLTSEGSATWDDLIKPVGESFLSTGELAADVAMSPAALFDEDHREKLGEHWDEFSENPGVFTVEHVGNLAIAGSALSKPLAGSARSAAGATKAPTHTARMSQLGDIAQSGGPGAGTARAARLLGDPVGHPYRAAGRQIADTRLPGQHSLREVGQQVRASSPRVPWTPEQRQAAELRRLEGDVERSRARLEDPLDETAAGRATEDLTTAETALGEFQVRNPDVDFDALRETRLAPLDTTELTSSTAKMLRGALESDKAKFFSDRLGADARFTKSAMNDLNDSVADMTMENLATRSPSARKRVADRNLRMVRRQDPELLKRHGIEIPRRGTMTDAARLEMLEKVRDAPEVREQLPNLDKTLDLTILDMYERVHDLPDGAIRNQLYDDFALSGRDAGNQSLRPAEQVREAQRQSANLPEEAQARVTEALGQAYRVPQEHLDNPIDALPSNIQQSYQGALDQLMREAADRDVTLAAKEMGSPEHWAMRVAEDLPEVPEGHTRVWRGQSDQSVEASALQHLDADSPGELSRRGQMFYRDRAQAEAHAQQLREQGLEDASLRYVDVPEAEMRAAGDDPLATLRDAAGSPGGGEVRLLPGRAAEAQTVDPSRLRPMRLGENPELTPALGKDLGRQLKDSGQAVAQIRRRVRRLREKAEKKQTIARSEIFRAHRRISAQVETISRELDEAKLPREQAGPMLDDLNKLTTDLNETLRAAGYENLPKNLTVSQARLSHAVNLGERGDPTAAARRSKSARKGFEERLLRDETTARIEKRTLDRMEQNLVRAEQRFDALEAEILASWEAAPAVARSPLRLAQEIGPQVDAIFREFDPAVADQLNFKGLPDTLQKMNEAGVSPGYLARLEVREGAVGQRAAQEGTLKTPTDSFQRRRTMADMEVSRDIDQVKIESDTQLASSVMARETFNEFAETMGYKADELGESLIEQGKINAEAWRDGRHNPQAKRGIEKMLRDEGYVVYDPTSPFSVKTKLTNLDTDTWIRKELVDSLERYSKDNMFEHFLKRVAAPATSTWKNFVLALRPAWHMYNIVGNAAMSMIAGRVAPTDYFRSMAGDSKEVLRSYKLGQDATHIHPELTQDTLSRLFEGGLSQDMAPRQGARAQIADSIHAPESLKRALDSQVSKRGGRVREGFNELTGASYRLNAYFDNLNRATVAMDQVVKKGADPEAALRMARQTLGDYRKMTPFEKTYMRSAFPFYAWMRHITTLSMRMLKPDNITRSAILGTMVETLSQPDEREMLAPDYMAGDIHIGDDNFIGTRGFNPWADVLGTVIYNNKISARGVAGSMHPAIQFLQERQSGTSTFTGRPFSRPVPELDDLGREVPQAPPVAEHLFTTFAPPQATLGRDVWRQATGQTRARYASGDPYLGEGAEPPSALAGIGSFFGVPIRQPDLEDMQERREESYDRHSRTIERYEAELEEYQQERAGRSLPAKILSGGQ